MAGSTMSTVLGQLACYTGKPLKWDDVANSEFQFGPAPDVASFETPPPSKPDATGIVRKGVVVSQSDTKLREGMHVGIVIEPSYPMPKPGISKLL